MGKGAGAAATGLNVKNNQDYFCWFKSVWTQHHVGNSSIQP